ncbi:hypothetical protein SESBI_05974 [Sesbania bispinosa]|nr:hypothetical protein SESBI_05974 [Sesbania bispinosa]
MKSEYVEHYERTTGHGAWHLGLASLWFTPPTNRKQRGDTKAECISTHISGSSSTVHDSSTVVKPRRQ